MKLGIGLISEFVYTYMLCPFGYVDDWDDVTLESRKSPFVGEEKIIDEDKLRGMDPSELYFSLYENRDVNLWDFVIPNTTESGRLLKQKGVECYKDWPEDGIVKEDLMELIRNRMGADMHNAPLKE